MRSRSKTASAINVLIVGLLFSIAHIRWGSGIGLFCLSCNYLSEATQKRGSGFPKPRL